MGSEIEDPVELMLDALDRVVAKYGHFWHDLENVLAVRHRHAWGLIKTYRAACITGVLLHELGVPTKVLYEWEKSTDMLTVHSLLEESANYSDVLNYAWITKPFHTKMLIVHLMELNLDGVNWGQIAKDTRYFMAEYRV